MLTSGIHPSTTASTFPQCPTPISQYWDGLHRSHAVILDVIFLRGSFKTLPESLLFLRNTKQYNHWSYANFVQNNPLVQSYTSSSDCQSVGNIPGSHFV